MLTKFSSKKYSVIMDSDIELKNKNYLNDVIDIIKNIMKTKILQVLEKYIKKRHFLYPLKIYFTRNL